jgi:hypothetical protein
MTSSLLNRKGQAMTETVLLFPVFLFFLFAFAKIFAMLVLVQKMEIASYYGARRWQLESHRNFDYAGFDDTSLRGDIEGQISTYLGYNSPQTQKFLGLAPVAGSVSGGPSFQCQRTQVWNVCTLEVKTNPPLDIGWMAAQMNKPMDFTVTKYVPNRDRPIAFVLPGVNQ